MGTPNSDFARVLEEFQVLALGVDVQGMLDERHGGDVIAKEARLLGMVVSILKPQLKYITPPSDYDGLVAQKKGDRGKLFIERDGYFSYEYAGSRNGVAMEEAISMFGFYTIIDGLRELIHRSILAMGERQAKLAARLREIEAIKKSLGRS